MKQHRLNLGVALAQVTVHPKECSETSSQTWVFPKMVVPQNGWFIVENPIQIDNLVSRFTRQLDPPLFQHRKAGTSFTPCSEGSP